MRALFARTALVAGLAVGLGALASACTGGSDPGGADLGDGGAGVGALEDGGAARARRPAIRFYMARTDKRCEVYSVEGDVISAPTPALCTDAIEVGERIRMAGRSCMREGRPDREQPVICPVELLIADYESRQPAEREQREARERAAREADGGASDSGPSDGGVKEGGGRRVGGPKGGAGRRDGGR